MADLTVVSRRVIVTNAFHMLSITFVRPSRSRRRFMDRRSHALACLISCSILAAPNLGQGRAFAVEPTSIPADGIDLTSTASEAVTKRVAEHVRRQLVRYRAFLPPRLEPLLASPTREVSASSSLERRELRIRLFGTLEAYRAEVAKRGLRVGNPACYIAVDHLILLGFDGAKFDDILSAAQERSKKIEEARVDTALRFAASQKEQELRFRRENVPDKERHDLLQRQNQEFQRSKAAAKRERKEADEKNEKLYDEATARLLALAAHELFHAYVEREVYPREHGGLPAWLDEGLAQFVENARWRNELPIVDAPAPELVKRLRDEAKNGEIPSVGSLLSLEGKHYLAGVAQGTDDVRRRYVFAWALVQLLAETKRLTPRESLDRYVENRNADPTTRFASFVKKSPAEFETEWRAYLAKLTR
ncbi:MAG: hypothetical protein K8U03_06545 [Planctomycetia bacterium]|nr:hypothetical protein [Planctomycetia bacterium]